MVAAIRRFKGARTPEEPGPLKMIRIDGRFDNWSDVRPEYRDTIGDTAHRDWRGWGSLHYTNTTGRNDITTAKVACDPRNVYFYVKTRDPLTPCTDPNWMLLLIDSDQDPTTGWHGYDYVVNSRVISPTVTTLRRVSDGKLTRIPYPVHGSETEIAIPRARIGQTGRPRIAFDFHWTDNIPFGADISRFSLDGDRPHTLSVAWNQDTSMLNLHYRLVKETS